MSSTSKAARYVGHSLGKAVRTAPRPAQSAFLSSRRVAWASAQFSKDLSARSFTAASAWRMPGLMPDTENPRPPVNEDHSEHKTAANIEEDEYHRYADDFMNKLHERAEAIMEERDDVEVEYSAGVLTITLPPNGSYVINKQPPNKQIWLSSPISGPKRFDWSIGGESMDQKEGTGSGDWIYLRDGTSFSDLLRKELGIDVSASEDLEKELSRKSTDPVE